jgi:hypothetical protein
VTEADARARAAIAVTVERLAGVPHELTQLRLAVERLAAAQAGRVVSTSDAIAATALWPAIAEHFAAGRVFQSREVIDFASAPLSTRQGLRTALLAAIGGGLDAGAAKRFGKFARRLDGVEVSGWRIERLEGCDRGGALWLLRLCEPIKPDQTRTAA